MNKDLSNYFNSSNFYDVVYGFYAINDRINLGEVLNFLVSLDIKLFLATKNIDLIHEFNKDLVSYYSMNSTRMCFLDFNLDKEISILLDDYLKRAYPGYNDDEICIHLFNELFKYDWKFHACNSCFLDSIKTHGINPSIMFITQHEIDELDHIFKKYNIDTIVGYQKKNCEKRVFFSSSPSVSYLYGINSPEWFSYFAGGGDVVGRGNPFNERDYYKSLNLLTKLMYSNGFNNEDRKIVKYFFDKCWNIFAINTSPELVIVKELNNYTIDMFKDKIKERNGLLQGCFNDSNVDCPWDKPIDTKTAIYITMPKYDEILKYIKKRKKIYNDLSTVYVGNLKIN